MQSSKKPSDTFPLLQILVEELQHAFLHLDAAGVWNLPNFCFQFAVGFLTFPGVMHDLESGLHATYGKEVVFGAVDKQHRLRTCQ